MTYCKTTHDLNNQTDKLDNQDLIDELVEEKANEFYDTLKQGKFIKVNETLYHIEDFIRETEIDPYLITGVINGSSLGLELFMIEALNNKCFELAKEVVV